eukprot:3221344-Amphidinium_carterae.1
MHQSVGHREFVASLKQRHRVSESLPDPEGHQFKTRLPPSLFPLLVYETGAVGVNPPWAGWGANLQLKIFGSGFDLARTV